MKLFPDCSDCCICAAAGNGCLAGIGDNDYYPATKEQVVERLDRGAYDLNRDKMINYLKEQFNYEYKQVKRD